MTTRRKNRARTEGALPDRVSVPPREVRFRVGEYAVPRGAVVDAPREDIPGAAQLAARCPRFADSTEVRARVEPHGTFANPRLHRVLGQVGAAR